MKSYFPHFFSLSLIFTTVACAPTRQTVSTVDTTPVSIDSAVLFAYARDSVTAGDFLYVYDKNNTDSSQLSSAAREKAIRDYLKLYVNFRLKVQAAKDANMDKRESFQQEFNKYQQQLAKPYMVENQVTEQLIQEAYQRLQQEVSAAHILITVDQNATPADTLAAWQRTDSLRQLALNGASFAMLAEQASDDPSAASNGGDLGYFSALQMVYPFETAAYATEPGSISEPVRTDFGYHIIKVKDKRPAQGSVKVAHILIRSDQNDSTGKGSSSQQKAEQIYNQLKKGADWNEMVERFSDDVSTRSSGGELPYFSTGNMVPEFESKAFALKNSGDISAPFQTRYGWHIIKLIDRQPLPSLEEVRATLQSRIQRSVRSEVMLEDVVAKLKKENDFQANEKNIVLAIQTFFKDTTTIAKPPVNAELLAIKGQKTTAGDFYGYVRKQQNMSQTDSATAYKLYHQFETKQVLAYEEAHLADKYEDYRHLLQEYRDGILLFDIMEQKVWSKASEDTAGLRTFFEAHRQDYRWKERVEATMMDAQDEATLDKVKTDIKDLSMPLSEEQMEEFEKKYNTASPLALQIHQGTYEKEGYRTHAESVIDQLPWKKGAQTIQHDGRMYYVVIHDVLSPKLKELDEVKGIVIADYQNYLDKQWITALRQKYPVEIHEDVLQQIIDRPSAP